MSAKQPDQPTLTELELALARIRGMRRRSMADTEALLERVGAVVQRRLEGVPCAVCGKLFQPKRSDAATCGDRCRQRLHRQRVTAEAVRLKTG